MRIRVYYEDTDAGGIVYHANYIKFCERARSEMFFVAGINFDENGYFVVSEINAKFKKPAVLGDMLEIRTRVVSLKKVSGVINQQIFRVGNLTNECEPELLFEADVGVAFMKNGLVAKMDKEIIEFLSSFCDG